MYEITNITRSPIQILIKSKKGAYNKKTGTLIDTNRAFKSLNIPGLGSGKNKVFIEDEKMTEYIIRLSKQQRPPAPITIKNIPDIPKK